MKVLITGAAGFIGMHVARYLSARGHETVGLDNFNDYYDPALKRARAALISTTCPILELELSDADAVKRAVVDFAPDIVVHLAAQAGVRYSLHNPMAYIQSNVAGHTAVLEACRALGDRLSHLVYASSSSVYGQNANTPFSETDPVNCPTSLYAATKRADELISSVYSRLFGIRQVGLRFFTAYGPWGRPDMAYWIFTEKILKGKPITVFNYGAMRRDFTWIGDIADGVIKTIETEPRFESSAFPHRVYNIGNRHPETLTDMIAILEDAIGKPAIMKMTDIQPGEMKETCADISAIAHDYGFMPAMRLNEGLPRFVEWYRDYFSV